jgi:drug/metabolite transporter (DMT)-like permease
MIQVIWLALLFNLATAFSIALTGDRGIISGNMAAHFWQILFNWKFILAMVLAVASRLLFMLINNQLLKIPSLAQNSTTITVFLTASSYIFIVLVNFLILNEHLTLQQIIGSVVVIAGIFIIMI